MLNYTFSIVIAFTIVIAAVVGIFRFRTIEEAYKPFFYYAWLNLANQILNEILIYTTGSNVVNANIYVFFEAVLFLWLYFNLKVLRSKVALFWITMVFASIWVADNLILHKLTTVNSLYRIVYSFVLIFLSIGLLNRIILSHTGDIRKHAGFLISVGVLIFYSFKAVVEVFYFVRLDASDQFYNRVFQIMILVSLVVYLIYGLAALCIPKKQRFTLQS